ncbi:MAG: hypothetical protein GEU90_08290 [Gemmatimonas sp.]|nr:hypothetical protein [Gemmatimonas sp.]
MERINGDMEMASDDGGIESHMHLGSGPADDRRPDSSAERGRELRERASSLAASFERAGEFLGKRTDIVSTIRTNPIVSVGAAFVTGFVIAAVTGSRSHHWAVDRARSQLKKILVGVATATIAQEVRSLINDEDLDDLDESIVEEGLERTGHGGAPYENDLDPFDESPF